MNYASGGNKECQLFCAKTAKSIITELYREYKIKTKNMLEKNPSKISFVIDCWTSSNQFPFQGVISRWINDDWELCTTVLDLTILNGSHSGINIANAFWDVLKDYNLCSKLLSVTTDNATNMDTMFDELEKLAEKAGIVFDSKNYRIRCFAHIMNLACKAMIQSIGDGKRATHSSDSESDEEEEEEKNNGKELPVVTKMRKGIVCIRKSPQRRELFSRQCVVLNIKPKIVLRDVRTRWNSTLVMMDRAKELKEPYDLTLRSIPKLRKYVLADDEWHKIAELIKLLSPFKEATVMLSNEHSPTISRISCVYQVLFDHLEKYLKNDRDLPEQPLSKRVKQNTVNVPIYPTWLVQAAKNGFEKLQKYYPSSDGLVYIVDTEPRYKLAWYKATGWPKEWIDFCRKSFTELYKTQYKPNIAIQEKQDQSVTVNENPKSAHSFEDLFAKQMQKYHKNSTDDDLKKYLTENVVDPDLLKKEKTGIDGVLGWWKIHQKEYPNLARMARDYLPASGTGVPVEALFSKGPDVISAKQQSMSAETIQMRICLKSWLKKKSLFDQEIAKAISQKLGFNELDNESL